MDGQELKRSYASVILPVRSLLLIERQLRGIWRSFQDYLSRLRSRWLKVPDIEYLYSLHQPKSARV